MERLEILKVLRKKIIRFNVEINGVNMFIILWVVFEMNGLLMILLNN